MSALALVGWMPSAWAQAQPPESLDAIVVTGERYFDEVPTSATKTRTPAVETPQSIVTVTREQMDDQNVQTVGSALRYSAGVLSDVDATSRFDTVFIRGFGGFSTSAAFVGFLDGLRLPRGQAFGQFSIDPYLLDRVEIVKGPAAVLYGQVNPGGLVNQTSRAATVGRAGEVRAEIGSDNRYQASMNSRGAVDSDGTWRYSLAALARASGTRFDDVDEKRLAIAPAVTWAPDRQTTLTLRGFYIDDPEGGYFNSALARSLAPAAYRDALNSKLNFGDPAVDDYDRTQYGVGYEFDRRFGAVSVHSALRYARNSTDFTGVQAVAPLTADGLLPRAAVQSDETAKGISTDNRLSADVNTGALVHRIVAGLDYQHHTADWAYGMAAAPALNVLNPVYGQSVGPFAPLIDNRQTQQQTGLYAQDQIDMGAWRLTLSTRHDWAEVKTRTKATGAVSKQKDEKTSYRAGLLYLFDSGIAPYVSYATSFEPTVGVDENGTAFRPTTARQVEGGVKYQPHGVPVLVTASVFDLRQDDTLTPSETLGFSVQEGRIGSRGLEVEVRGDVTDSLEMIASVTALDTEVKRSTNAAIIGKRPQAIPEWFASAWASYRVPAGPLAGLNLGGGVRYVAASYGDDLNTVRTPSYTIADLAIRYELEKLIPSLGETQLTLNVSNLFDKEYYTSCSYNIYCQFGNRRQVLGGVRHAW
ncbi:TonB-dependent siderophore receptor [Oleisolibacter albus]|uniref:TonB-dependent siderophore receptor n=1 Tax=Oleisolibacter albus TaxID=2171757 RepID=UPI001960F877|nr:TonB-dependent siderophore receptor [Oleisolibacter albus]